MFRMTCLVTALCAASLAACGPSGGIASPGSTPVSTAAATTAAIADATLPPPAAISPTAKTTIDDAAISVAWDALDTAAFAADALLAAKPKVAGTPAARQLASALEGTATWLTIASQAQRASQADNYRVALQQAAAALSGAQAALGTLKAN